MDNIRLLAEIASLRLQLAACECVIDQLRKERDQALGVYGPKNQQPISKSEERFLKELEEGIPIPSLLDLIDEFRQRHGLDE